MKEILEQKDQLVSSLSTKVGKLEVEIENLQKGYNFMSMETSELKNKHSIETSHTNRKVGFLESKTQDLEDRSRRNNLVFFSVDEVDGDHLLTTAIRKSVTYWISLKF